MLGQFHKFMFVAAALVATPVLGHMAPSGMEYEPFCCQGDNEQGDCQPVKESTVKIVDGGFQVTLDAGDHRLVTRHHVFFVPYQKSRLSTDTSYHVCLFPDEDTLRCFYRPMMSF